MYRTIIVPVDPAQEDKGRAIFERARKLADKGARIILVSVLEDIPAYVAHELPAHIMNESRSALESRLKAIAAGADDNVETVVRTGHPGNQIIELAEKEGADLILVASHRPGLQDYFIGSTAGRVVRHATCSVLVVR